MELRWSSRRGRGLAGGGRTADFGDMGGGVGQDLQDEQDREGRIGHDSKWQIADGRWQMAEWSWRVADGGRDWQIRGLEKAFVEEGGLREAMTRARLAYRDKGLKGLKGLKGPMGRGP